MERLYLSITGDSATIHHRPTHEYIACGSVKEMAVKVKELLAMDTEDFYTYLINNVPFIRLEGKRTQRYRANFNEAEDWFKKAWTAGTNAFFRKYKLKQVDEEVPFELVDKLYDEKKHRDSKGKSAFSIIVDEEDKWEEPLVKKKLVKASAIEVTNILDNAKKKLVPQHKKKKKLIRKH